MAGALRGLATQPRPSQVVVPGLMDGLERIRERFASLLEAPLRRPALSQAAE
jgi:hypothetical protein